MPTIHNAKRLAGETVFKVEGDDALEREMQAFDGLSPRARAAMRGTMKQYSAIQIAEMIEQMGEAQVLDILRRG